MFGIRIHESDLLWRELSDKYWRHGNNLILIVKYCSMGALGFKVIIDSFAMFVLVARIDLRQLEHAGGAECADNCAMIDHSFNLLDIASERG